MMPSCVCWRPVGMVSASVNRIDIAAAAWGKARVRGIADDGAPQRAARTLHWRIGRATCCAACVCTRCVVPLISLISLHSRAGGPVLHAHTNTRTTHWQLTTTTRQNGTHNREKVFTPIYLPFPFCSFLRLCRLCQCGLRECVDTHSSTVQYGSHPIPSRPSRHSLDSRQQHTGRRDNTQREIKQQTEETL